MKRKLKFFGYALLVAIAVMAGYMWGQYDGEAGKGIEIVKKAEAAGEGKRHALPGKGDRR